MVAKSLLDALTERETQMVEPEAYLRLITSRRRLVRSNDETRGLLGVFDLDSRVRFVVEERKLWSRAMRDGS
jgi:hypothetical protein